MPYCFFLFFPHKTVICIYFNNVDGIECKRNAIKLFCKFEALTSSKTYFQQTPERQI